jgi:hypothetical protein
MRMNLDYTFRNNSNSALAHYTLPEFLDVFTPRVVTGEKSLAPTNSSPVVPSIVKSLPHRPRHT